jgi:hypothetical protein
LYLLLFSLFLSFIFVLVVVGGGVVVVGLCIESSLLAHQSGLCGQQHRQRRREQSHSEAIDRPRRSMATHHILRPIHCMTALSFHRDLDFSFVVFFISPSCLYSQLLEQRLFS